ncbi:MAG: alpha/beta hydrolase family protein [Thermoproteota archaeon]|jgi:cephalosporin-C deacetylase-like acetyl esterase
MEEYRPLTYYKKLYEQIERKFSFRAKSIEEWQQWKNEFRSKLIELINLDYPESELEPKKVEEKEFQEYVREKVIFRSDKFSLVPAYVLVPKNREDKLPAVVAMHGHGYGKNDLVGIWEDGTERINPSSRGYHKDFALELVKKGLIVIVPEQAGFGERREEEDIKKGPYQSSCWSLSTWALMLGKTTIGRRVWDAMRAIDYLQTRDDVKKDAIGMMGISGGGTTTLFTSALDERVKATVISGYLNTFKDSILSIYHCIDNFIPGILKYGEMYDVASLIAPRALLIESGTKDDIFPIESAKYAYEKVREVYRFLNAENKVDSDFFEGRHEISGRKAYDFLAKWLHAEKP